MTMVLTSPAFADDGIIPKKYGYKHGNTSIPLKISGIPQGTASLAMIMDDPDAMGAVGKVWVHWVLWNISPESVVEIKEDYIPSGCLEGETDFGAVGYGGPAPPDKEHTYVFTLYALDNTLNIAKGSTKAQVEEAISHIHTMEKTVLKGRYSPQ